jgi:hypothetical protein
VNIMQLKIMPAMHSARVLHEAELDTVVGGMAASQALLSQAWVSPMAIHGFNPQPDPPAIWNPAMAGPAAHA